MTTHNEIRSALRDLERDRRETMHNLMVEYDKMYHAARRVLYDKCGSIGHNMIFTHTGPVGHPWFRCTVCGMSEVKDLDE